MTPLSARYTEAAYPQLRIAIKIRSPLSTHIDFHFQRVYTVARSYNDIAREREPRARIYIIAQHQHTSQSGLRGAIKITTVSFGATILLCTRRPRNKKRAALTLKNFTAISSSIFQYLFFLLSI